MFQIKKYSLSYTVKAIQNRLAYSPFAKYRYYIIFLCLILLNFVIFYFTLLSLFLSDIIRVSVISV